MTLLEIYETWLNGNKKQFIEHIKDYGPIDFLLDIIEEYNQGALNKNELLGMKNTIRALL